MYSLRNAGFSIDARRHVLSVCWSVEFKGYAYRTLAEGREPHVMAEDDSTVKRLFVEAKSQETECRQMPEGFEVLRVSGVCVCVCGFECSYS